APIHPLRVCAALAPHVEAGAVLVADGGEFGQWVQAGLEPRERLINGLSGSIGSALPMAVAAKLACPDRPVLAVMGDGTFGFHPFELDTALRHAAPIVVVVGNDARSRCARDPGSCMPVSTRTIPSPAASPQALQCGTPGHGSGSRSRQTPGRTRSPRP